MSDWIMSKICDGIFCNTTSSRNLLLIGWHLILHSSQHLSLCLNSTFFSTEKMNKCIRMGITAFKVVIWGCKSAVLQSEILFYGDADVHRKTKFQTIKQIWMQLSPNLLREMNTLSGKIGLSKCFASLVEGVVMVPLFVCVEVLPSSQPIEVVLSMVSLPNHAFTGQA